MPAKKRILPYGTWPSPVTPQLAARTAGRTGSLQAGDGAVYWSEPRPEEQGRQVIVRAGTDGRRENILPAPYSARSRVHEYGGGELTVAGDTVYFVNDKDQQVYVLASGGQPQKLTDAPRTRFADLMLDATRERLIGVAETHVPPERGGAHSLPANTLVAVALGGAERGRVRELAAGRDFYASARVSPDGASLAFIAWDLPDMPWDSAALYVARVRNDGSLGRPSRIAGGKGGKGSAVFQPEWGPDGHLYFAWDESGWGSLYRWNGERVSLVLKVPRTELWRPQFAFALRCFAIGPDGNLCAALLKDGLPLLEAGTLGAGKLVAQRVAPRDAARIEGPVAVGNRFAAVVSPPLAMPAVMWLDRGRLKPVAPTPPAGVDPGYLSRGKVCELRNAKREKVLAIHYPPRNADHDGPRGALPPALVLAHGGPTSMTDASLKMRVQFYTSRGFAVVDVNYGGSTGFGRAYRERLNGQWGIADVADCASAARFLAREGLADPDMIAIAGGSAGGYTTLMALATTKVFAAGASHYGISDLGLLMEHTHKFESGYLHRLLGTTPSKWKAVCAERSPLTLIDGITAPVILFQGLDDKVVPPEQSRLIVEKLKARGIDVACHEYAGEGHGFRKAETIVAVLEAELAFLRRVMGVG
ncbi:MAG: prolyl oligopeptidase family serine peptidase [Hyphomicrobiaceae bacterium]